MRLWSSSTFTQAVDRVNLAVVGLSFLLTVESREVPRGCTQVPDTRSHNMATSFLDASNNFSLSILLRQRLIQRDLISGVVTVPLFSQILPLFKGRSVCREYIPEVGDLEPNLAFCYHSPEILKTVEEGKQTNNKQT